MAGSLKIVANRSVDTLLYFFNPFSLGEYLEMLMTLFV